MQLEDFRLSFSKLALSASGAAPSGVWGWPQEFKYKASFYTASPPACPPQESGGPGGDAPWLLNTVRKRGYDARVAPMLGLL